MLRRSYPLVREGARHGLLRKTDRRTAGPQYSTGCDAYLDYGRASDAVATNTALLEIRRNDCRPGSDKSEECAAAKQSLGYSEMVAEDFQAALSILRDAEVNFGAAAKPGDLEPINR